MKKYLCFVFWILCSLSGAHAEVFALGVPPGFVGGVAGNFTYTGNWGNVGGPEVFVSFYNGGASRLSYNLGSFDFAGLSLNGRPWDGYNDHFPGGTSENPALTITFMDINGVVLATGEVTLAATDNFSTFSQHVSGVHTIEFSAPASQFFVRVASVTMVPEPTSYLMLAAGGLLLLVMRKRKSVP